MSFHVGQKVVCVDASTIPDGALFVAIDGSFMVSNGQMGGLRRGEIYTIREIRAGAGGANLILAEITRDPILEPGFSAHRFRPIVSRKTDISIFKRMLLPQGEDA